MDQISRLLHAAAVLAVLAAIALLFLLQLHQAQEAVQGGVPKAGQALPAPASTPAARAPLGTLDQEGCLALPDGLRICELKDDDAASASPLLAPGRRFPAFTDTERPPRPEAVQVVDWIVRIAGVARNFEVIEGEFKGGWIALAGARDGRRYLLYDRKMFDWADGKVRWRHVAIMAHEIAHHLNGDTTGTHGPVHQHEMELAADSFAGFVVARLGGTLDQALSMPAMLNEEATPTHPARADRIRAVTMGWQSGRYADGRAME